MKKLVITLSIVVSGLMSQAQQVPLLSHYYYNKFVWNPALAGIQKYGQAYLMYRNQWNQIPGAPITKAVTIDGPLKKKNIGLGASLYQDNAGIFSRTGGMISYAYGINISDDSKLKLGMGLGFIDNRLSLGDAVIKHTDDPLLRINNNNKTGFDANFGVNYSWKDLNIGVSIPQVLALDMKYDQSGLGEDNLVYKNTRHFQFNVNYVIKAMEDKVKIEPSAFIRLTPNAPLQYDVTAVVSYRDFIWGGLMYRSQFAMGLMAGVRLAKQFVIGYAYDLPVNQYKTYMRGANEVMLGFQFGGGVDDDEMKKRLKGIDDRLNAHDTKIEDLDKRVKGNTEDIDKLKKDVKKNTDDNVSQGDDIEVLKKMFEEFKAKLGKGSVAVGDVYEFQNVFFATNSYDLSGEAKAEIDQLAEIMKENPALKIEISGHTDERGSDEYNMRLSQRRSKAVIDYLVAKGLGKDRFTIANYGEKKPASSDLTANRRVEFKVLEK
jgi:type IX secretion system PorP/SprF family membrane protein